MRLMPAPGVLAFLHTARPNVDVFRQLIERIDPSVPTRHEVLESVLTDAVGTGVVTEAMRQQTEAAVRALVRDGATLVVCTCSTIGGVAEATRVDDGARVMRIDRPMAEQAVASGRRIVIAATLPSTVRPTRALIEQVAGDAGRTVEIGEVLCGDAWPHFERGDRAAYAEAIATTVAAAARPGDMIVLAQASMAPAAERISAQGIAVLASPEPGVRAAVELYRGAEEARPTR
jgi:hypothetical protein